MGKGKNKRLDWQDFYYDSIHDMRYWTFDEDSQRAIKFSIDDGWDKIDKCEKDEYIEDDEYLIGLKLGKIDRVR